jgi:hypothetical protein
MQLVAMLMSSLSSMTHVGHLLNRVEEMLQVWVDFLGLMDIIHTETNHKVNLGFPAKLSI